MKVKYTKSNNIKIVLSEDQADDLFTVLGTIGGPPFGTIRETIDPLYQDLETLGLVVRWERLAGLYYDAVPVNTSA